MYTEETMRSICRIGVIGVFLILLVFITAPNAQATAVYGTNLTGSELIGSRSFPVDINGHGIDTTCSGNQCITQMTVAWNITLSAGTWTYNYTVTYNPPDGNTNDIIIDTNAGMLGSTCQTDANCLTPTSGNIFSSTFGTYTAANGQPPGNLPGLQTSITGFDLHITSNQQSGTTYSFTSDRAPVWSDFDLELAGSHGNFFNTGNETANRTSMSTLDFLPGPSGAPEPATWALIGLGLIAMGAGTRFRKRLLKR